MKAEDQEQMRKILSEERKNISPDSRMKERLDQAFEARHQKNSVVPIWINYPIPAWQVAATVALLIVAGILIGRRTDTQPIKEMITMVDTVYVDKLIPGKTDTVIIERIREIEQAKETVNNTAISPTEPASVPVHPEGMNPNLHISDFHHLKPNGSPLSEDSAAQDWMVRIM